jgi:hypothetical protein
MAGTFDIPKYKKGDPLHAATVNTLTDEVRKLNRVRTGSGLTARVGAGGLMLAATFPTIPHCGTSSGIIPAAPGPLELGEGEATLQTRDGVDLIDDDDPVAVFNKYAVAIPDGTGLVVVWDGDGYIIVGADCPTA